MVENSDTEAERNVRRTERPVTNARKIIIFPVYRTGKKVHQLENEENSSSEVSCLKVETISLVPTKAKQWFTKI